MDRRVTSPKRVTSPTWGPPPPCKQALKMGVMQGLKAVCKFVKKSNDWIMRKPNKLKISLST